MEQIYTQENINNIEEIELLKFRRIKFQLKENKWKEKRYCNLEGFKKDLIKYQPLNVYYSLSMRNHFYKKKVMKQEYVVDIDRIDKDEVKKVIKILPNYERIVFSGGGYQIIYDLGLINKQKAKSLTMMLKNKGINFDYNTSLVPSGRVVRYPTTFNSRKNRWSYSLHKVFETKGEEKSYEKTKKNNNLISKREDPLLPITYNYITNKFKKSFVFYHIFDNIKKAKKMDYINKRFNLEPLYYIQLEQGRIAVLSNKILSKERLLKIYKKGLKLNKNSCLKIIRTSMLIKDDNFYSKPKLLLVKGDERKDNYSKYINYYLDYLGFSIEGKKKKPYIFKK